MVTNDIDTFKDDDNIVRLFESYEDDVTIKHYSEFSNWISKELAGYAKDDTLPIFRLIRCHLHIKALVPFKGLQLFDSVPFDETYDSGIQSRTRFMEFREPIPYLSEVISTSPNAQVREFFNDEDKKVLEKQLHIDGASIEDAWTYVEMTEIKQLLLESEKKLKAIIQYCSEEMHTEDEAAQFYDSLLYKTEDKTNWGITGTGPVASYTMQTD